MVIGGRVPSIHIDARRAAERAINFALNEAPDEHAVRHLAAVGYLETGYGRGWKGAGVGSNNMGAIQAGAHWTGDTFEYIDTHPESDGSSTAYRAQFRKYATPQDGWDDLARVMFTGRRHCVMVSASMGDTYTVSQWMRETGYYEGFGPTQNDRIRNHFLALRRGLWVADRVEGIEVPGGSPVGIPSTVRIGARGDDVKTLQRELQIAADGIFGPITERAVLEYQEDHDLIIDGIVGPKTWAALFSDGYTPEFNDA